MVLDLERWLSHGISHTLERFAKDPEFEKFHIQDLLQLHFENAVDVLNWRWNFAGLCWGPRFPQGVLDQARILHFCGEGKPWHPATFENKCLVIQIFLN